MKKAHSQLTIICKFCGKDFKVSYGERDRKYCGRSCQSKAITRSDIRKISKCLICKKPFKHYGERVVCSHTCNARYMSFSRLGINNPTFNPNKIIHANCQECGKKFTYTKSGHKQVRQFCSLFCTYQCWRGKGKKGGEMKPQVYPLAFKRIKNIIKTRDDNKCTLCGNNHLKLHVHHIDYNKNNNQEANLITLCMRCHMLTNYCRYFWLTVFSALLSGSKLVRKDWGIESWITNNVNYCLKYLIFFKGKNFSLHKHVLKKELWHCLLGKFECILQYENGQKNYHIFRKGDKIEIEPNTLHQLKALENSIIVEVSTQHFNEDSIRINT